MSHAESVIFKCEEIYRDWQELTKPPFRALEVVEILKDLCGAAELVIVGDKQGPLRHKTVREAFDILDKKLNLIGSIDRAVKLPFWLEAFDGPAIRACIDLLIHAIVATLNGFSIKQSLSQNPN